MPELNDDMYCSQQIMVPPMFPYLLRQYAKAAIRSQPTDLLRWSTAYFRCLSLNLPPPIKPRLEYPIPKDYDGITPGWLKALLHQFQNSQYVDFKVLWDRWIGACLNHDTLIKILCLSGFTNPYQIPFFRFVALCVAFLSENLTQTMMMVCEVLTEEPEGGSAMITLETFIDTYVYLASIDASKDQIIINRYFTDDLLQLLEKKAKKKVIQKPPSIIEVVKEESIIEEVEEEETKEIEERKDEISCPDLIDDQLDDRASSDRSDDDLLKEQRSKSTIIFDTERRGGSTSAVDGGTGGQSQSQSNYRLAGTPGAATPAVASSGNATPPTTPSDVAAVKEMSTMGGDKEDDESKFKAVSIVREDDDGKQDDGVDDDQSRAARDLSPLDDDVTDYLQRLESIGEESHSVGSYPQSELEQHSTSQEISSAKDKTIEGTIESFSLSELEVEEEEEQTAESEVLELKEIFVEAIPGVGSVVPIELINTVREYMKTCAKAQHGMVMPRNIRHYSCPPLEVFD